MCYNYPIFAHFSMKFWHKLPEACTKTWDFFHWPEPLLSFSCLTSIILVMNRESLGYVCRHVHISHDLWCVILSTFVLWESLKHNLTLAQKKNFVGPKCNPCFFLNWCLHSHRACQSMVWFMGRNGGRRVQLACGQESGGVNPAVTKPRCSPVFSPLFNPSISTHSGRNLLSISAPLSDRAVNSNIIKKYLCV